MRIETRHTRRLNAISAVGLAMFCVLIYRLVTLQVLAADEYAALARNQQEARTRILADRGRILDRNGRILSRNVESQSFFASSRTNPEAVRAIVGNLAPNFKESNSRIRERLRAKRPFVWLARRVEDGPAIDRLPEGVGREIEMLRKYPMGDVAGQLLGYTDVDNVGIEGLELAFDSLLRGKAGEMVLSVDALGKHVNAREAVRRPAEDGEDLVLTIDLDYQCIAEEELESVVKRFQARSGIAIVTNPLTGEILAMANVPRYDPNDFGRYDPALRRNRAVTDIYEPGSTFKIVAVAGALNEGRIDLEEKIFCENGVLSVPGGEIRDHDPYGWLSVGEILKFSSNIGAAKVARALGPGGMNRYVRLFGYGATTGSDLPGEVSGEARHPSKWSRRSLETISIGQEIGVTALQMAAAYGAIANEGRLVTPRIRLRAGANGAAPLPRKPDVVRQVVTPETARLVTSFLEEAVNGGTGRRAQVPGYRVAGKTGTAQRALENGAGYDPERFIASFIGFIPADRPELLCLVIVDGPKGIQWGSQVAAPVFNRIMRRILGLRNTELRHRTELAEASRLPGSDGPLPAASGLARETASRVPARHVNASRAPGRGDGVAASTALAPEETVHTPDVTGIPLRQAIHRLTSTGLRVKASGSGRVVRQVPRAGTRLSRGSFCEVTCSRREG